MNGPASTPGMTTMTTLRRESPYPAVSVDEARRLITSQSPPPTTEVIDFTEAHGRVLAETISADEPLPDCVTATVDGYALRADEGTQQRRIAGHLPAGSPSASLPVLEPGTAIAVMTGAPLPPEADTVVMVEQTEERDGMLHLLQPVRPGEHLRAAGEDISPGTCLLEAGTSLGAVEIGLLATIGRTCIHVYRRPRVAVFSTGSELVEPATPRQPGAVRDSNRYALLAATREAGGQAIALDIVPDDEQIQRETLVRALSRADVVVSSGGVSMGTRDLIKPLLAEHGTIHFGRVQMRPGKPTTFATVHGRLVFGLPGNPVSALVAFEVFVRPLLRRFQGDTSPERPRVRVVLDDPFPAVPDRPSYHRAVVEWRDGRLMARSTGSQASSRLLSLRGANALLLGPAADYGHAPGDELDALLIGPIRSDR